MQPNPSCEPLLLFQAIVEQTPDAVIFSDPQGTIRLWNRGAEAVFGFAADEVLGQSLDLIIPERMREAHWTAMHRAIDEGQVRGGSRVRTTRSLHKDGRKLYVDLSFSLIVDAAGSVLGAAAVGRDCTERYLAEKALRERLALWEAKPAS